MRQFLGYYKWHLLFLLIIIICFVYAFTNMTSSTEPDLVIGYVGTEFVNEQIFDDSKSEIEEIMSDANDDDKKVAKLQASTVDVQSELDEVLLAMVEAESFDIYISTKETFETFEDKFRFLSVNEYMASVETGKYETLKDGSGRIYAVSLEDNDYIKELGLTDTTNLYIAVAADELEDGEEIPESRKNGMNIAQFIIKESVV